MPFDIVAQTGGGSSLVVIGAVLATLVIALAAAIYRMALFSALSGGDTLPPDAQTNCPACGARIPDDAVDCEYCGESLDERSSRSEPEI